MLTHFAQDDTCELHTLLELLAPPENDRRADAHRRVSTDKDTEALNETEVADGRATLNSENHANEERRERGNHRTAEALVQRAIDGLFVLGRTEESGIFTDTVEVHDGVVDRVTNHREERSDQGTVERKAECRDEAERDDGIVRERYRAMRESQTK